MKINSINQSIKKAIIKPLNNTSIWNADKNDLSSQLRKCTMLEFFTDFLANILSAIGWKKIIDEKEDNKDNESDL